jgi:hypothetical protein
MILFKLVCGGDHPFEAWFRNGDSYSAQAEKGAISCPVCGDGNVRKAPMAPGLLKGATRRQEKLAALRQAVERDFEDVGAEFAEEARQIHYGEAEARPIRGRTSLEDAKELLDEGIPVLPLPWATDHDA